MRRRFKENVSIRDIENAVKRTGCSKARDYYMDYLAHRIFVRGAETTPNLFLGIASMKWVESQPDEVIEFLEKKGFIKKEKIKKDIDIVLTKRNGNVTMTMNGLVFARIHKDGTADIITNGFPHRHFNEVEGNKSVINVYKESDEYEFNFTVKAKEA